MIIMFIYAVIFIFYVSGNVIKIYNTVFLSLDVVLEFYYMYYIEKIILSFYIRCKDEFYLLFLLWF